MNCNYKVKITDIQTKYKFKVFCTGYDDSEIKEKIDVLYQAWPKATAEGETPTLDNTANATMSIDLKGNTSQNGTPTPSTPIPVSVVSGDNEITISNSDNTQSTSYPISLGDIELCKIGDYQDRIYKDNGKWYIEKQIGKVVFNGSENWSNFSVAQGNLFRNNSVGVSIINIAPISNYFIGVNSSDSRHDGTIYYNYTATIEHTTFDILSSKFSSAEDFKDWLSTHNTIVYYALATPTTTEITDTTLISQLEAIKEAESYSGQTNISQTNDDKPFILTAKALKDLSNL